MKPLIAATLLLASSIALANSCPKEMQAIDAKLSTGPSLAMATLDKIKQLRSEGESLHKAGKHAESMSALGEAKKLLGI